MRTVEVMHLYGLKVFPISEERAAVYKKRQYRFPKSKKKRILKKWRKNPKNYQLEKMKNREQMFKTHDSLFVGPKAYEEIKKNLPLVP